MRGGRPAANEAGGASERPPGRTPPLKAAFVANGDPRDLKLWSGTPYHMLAALERRFDLRLVVRRTWPTWYRPVGRALKLLSGGRFEYSWSRRYSALAASRMIRRLQDAGPDVVFSVALTDIAYLFTDRLPVVTITDAVIPDLIDYYDMFRRLSPTAKRNAIAAEKKAFDESLMLHFPSRWACRSAMEKQGVPEDKVAEIAWGANMPYVPRPPRTLGEGPVRLLFVGAQWDRKGGPIAVETAASLAARGVDCRLDVIGCSRQAIDGPMPENVTFHGFIDKGTKEGQTRLDAFYREATLFFLPTLAEAYGIVFAEAAHHGLPSLAYATGGVTSVVRNGETGMLLPPGAGGAAFADAVESLLGSPERYAAMSRAALDDARERLNWDVWAETLENAVRSRLETVRPVC